MLATLTISIFLRKARREDLQSRRERKADLFYQELEVSLWINILKSLVLHWLNGLEAHAQALLKPAGDVEASDIHEPHLTVFWLLCCLQNMSSTNVVVRAGSVHLHDSRRAYLGDMYMAICMQA